MDAPETKDGPAEPEVEGRLGCFPFGFKRESKELFKLAWPLSLSILFHYLIQPISLMFCGHLGDHQLAAVGMAISVIYITTVSFGRGLAFGGDTYFAQTYGSSNKKMMGVYLQRGLLFGVLCSFPIWAILLNTESILLLIGQDPEVSRLSQEYVQLFMPGVLAYCWLFLLMRYLLCQNRVIPNMMICMVSCGVNALLHYGLLYQADMGIKGSAIALMSTYYLVLFLFVAYIWGSGIYKETWAGWSWECLEEWGPFGHTVVSSIIMTFMYWLCTEVGTFLAGLLGEKEISAFQIMFQVEGFAWMIPLGLGGACSSRVGQYLGANQPLGAITATRVTLAITVLISITLGGGCYALKHYIPMAFTSSEVVISFTERMVPILAIFLLLEGFGGAGVGIVRGSGRQTIGAIIIFVSYYMIALPVGIPLMFLTNLGLAGIWWGYVLGLGMQDIFLMIFVVRLDWHEEANKAQVRAGVDTKDPPASENDPASSEPDERTRLLGPRGQIQQTPDQYNSRAYEQIGQEDSHPRRAKLIIKRLATLLAFSAILVAGILTRLYVKVKVHEKWTPLCIPFNDTVVTTLASENVNTSIFDSVSTVTSFPMDDNGHSQTFSPFVDNTTLQFCNYTNPSVASLLSPPFWGHPVV